MPDHDYPDQTQADAILETLEEASPATIAELAAALDDHPVTVERRCRALQRAGEIRQSTGGVYTLVESDLSARPTATPDAPADQHTTNPAD
ncbi:helix-turn-helix domain-containing protein [Natronolimnohabitans innermongolicus]|uniref:DeoR family transcriptional regulator n=1 Tax=Natronolimnohabitans innermongolicus JCM 12255 TaxID=1227499 RepID=L9WP78_9EURY|nr:Lrp/AsnC family transcriptional regulator [Natronolimnohabitans innermongolicus]ELY51192.1 DeoR family transcriptional regulator [Natronolimnohabitans innermongolicus JCM 12255]